MTPQALHLRSATISAIFGIAVTVLPLPAWSQIEEIVVTTRKTAENLQDIPISVAALDSDFIEKQNIATTGDVLKFVPGVQFDQSFSAADTRISIRGINSERGRTSVAILVDGVDVSGENITAGGGSSLLNTRLLDLERVEVVKGPQSALYGRNAFAGAINYITRKPSLDNLEIRTFGDLAANYTIYDVRGSISGPIVDGKLALSVNAGAYKNEGYYENNNPTNPTANVGLGGSESVGGRFVAYWAPADTFSAMWSIAYSERDSEPRAVAKVDVPNTFYLNEVQLPAGTPPDYSMNGTMTYGQYIGTVGSVDERNISLSISERNGAPFAGSEDNTLLTYLKLDWDIGNRWLFKSQTSYLQNEAFLHEDAEFQSGFGTPIVRNGVATNFSVENDYLDQTDTEYAEQIFTIETSAWDRGRFLLGVQGFWETTENADFSLGWFNDPNFEAGFPEFCVALNPLDLACSYRDSARIGEPPKTIDRETDSYSVFGLLGFDITESLRVTGELRWIEDEITVTTNTSIDRVSQYILAIPIDTSLPLDQLPVSDTQKSDTVNPRFAVDWRITDDHMVYGSVAKGTKPAGFGTAQFAMPQNTKIDQEELWGYEFGAKTTWLQNTLLANVAFFFNDYTDRQVGVTVRDPVSGWASAGIVNAAGAETKGVELELLWNPIDPLTLTFAYAYTDAEWTDFKYEDIRAETGGIRPKDQAICANAAGDCSGANIAGVPEHAATFQANWTKPIAGGDLEYFINAIAAYQDERAVYDRVRTAFIDSYTLVDAQLGIQSPYWSVMVYADNLLDDDSVRWGQGYQDFQDGMYGGGAGGEPRDETIMAFLPPPRVVGIRGTWRFGD